MDGVVIRGAGEGVVVRAAGLGGGGRRDPRGISLVTQPSGIATPLHVHTHEAEAFYLLDGTIALSDQHSPG